MNPLSAVYNTSLALLTDLYELTMAYGYWKAGKRDHEAVFHLFFRNHPFQGGFTVAAGLGTAIEFLKELRFSPEDQAYLAAIQGNDGKPLFDREFVAFLGQMHWQCDIDGIPEGTIVFPHEPLLRVQGPLIQAQLVESALLNILNFQTLIATKTARIVLAARGEPVLEFGLRRAQGIDGALTASRAAYIGGCAATSNVLAGKTFGIPVKGTHAHSWVMCFDDEIEAFRAYARAMPNNCVFLVDTYDTLQGVRNAVIVARELRQRGHELVGIRLDSGDLAWLSTEARKILDEAGFPLARIVASNELDEAVIASLKDQGAAIACWGVGTRLVTAYDEPALGGVYKLSAIRGHGEAWQYKVKLSEQAAKATNPGILQVRRYSQAGRAIADLIYDQEMAKGDGLTMVDPLDSTRRKVLPPDTPWENLLVPLFRRGEQVYDIPSLEMARSRLQEQLAAFHGGVKRFLNPHRYPVGLELGLHERKTKLILRARGLAT